MCFNKGVRCPCHTFDVIYSNNLTARLQTNSTPTNRLQRQSLCSETISKPSQLVFITLDLKILLCWMVNGEQTTTVLCNRPNDKKSWHPEASVSIPVLPRETGCLEVSIPLPPPAGPYSAYITFNHWMFPSKWNLCLYGSYMQILPQDCSIGSLMYYCHPSNTEYCLVPV